MKGSSSLKKERKIHFWFVLRNNTAIVTALRLRPALSSAHSSYSCGMAQAPAPEFARHSGPALPITCISGTGDTAGPRSSLQRVWTSILRTTTRETCLESFRHTHYRRRTGSPRSRSIRDHGFRGSPHSPKHGTSLAQRLGIR